MVIQRREINVIPHQIPKQIANQRAQQRSQMGYSPGAWVWFGSVGLLLREGRGLLSLRGVWRIKGVSCFCLECWKKTCWGGCWGGGEETIK